MIADAKVNSVPRADRRTAPYLALIAVNALAGAVGAWMPEVQTGAVWLIAVLACLCVAWRPLGEMPFALLVAGCLRRDELIFVVLALAAARLFVTPGVRLTASAGGRLLVLFGTSVAVSALVGAIFVEFRPLQTALWVLTFFIWLMVLVARVPAAAAAPITAYTRMFVVAMASQAIAVLAQLVHEWTLTPGDWAMGTWNSANYLGYWATVTAAAVALVALSSPRDALGPARPRMAGLFAVAVVLAVAAEAKIYSAGVLLVAGAVAGIIVARELVRNRVAAAFKLFGVVMVAVAALSAGHAQVARVWTSLQASLEISRKTVFLDRVFFQQAERFNPAFGTGPGTAGSRAANAVAADILYKEEVHVPPALAGSTVAQRWAMGGLWDEELYELIGHYSSVIVMPFSGVGAVKAELGYAGLLLLLVLLVAVGTRAVRAGLDPQMPPETMMIHHVAGLGLLGMIPVAVFDTLWEMPQITAIVASALLATGGAAARTRPQPVLQRRWPRHDPSAAARRGRLAELARNP